MINLVHMKEFQNFVRGYLEMNKAGNYKYFAGEPEDKAKGVVVCTLIAETKNSTDLIFLHFQENSYCFKKIMESFFKEVLL